EADISPTEIISPSGCVGVGSNLVEVEVTNMGADTINGFDISYVLNGGTVVTESNPSVLLPGRNLVHQFATNANFASTGKHDLLVYTSTPADTLNLNDTITANYEIFGIPATI